MRKWRIYYESCTYDNFSASSSGTLPNAPGEGVIGIVQEDSDAHDVYANGREYLCDRDFYWWADDRWVKGDLCGLFDYLRQPGLKKVLAGRTVNRTLYQETLLKMQADPDFPERTTRHV